MNDVSTIRIVIAILGVLSIVSLGGAIALAILGVDTPQILVATIASCSGALVGIIVSSKGPTEFRRDPGGS